MKQTKAEIRKEILKKRQALAPNEVEELSRKVLQNLISQSEKVFPKSVQKIAFYSPIWGEVDARIFFEYFRKQQKTCLFPKATDEKLEFFTVNSLSDLSPGFKGILEPKAQGPLFPEVLFVPGLAFGQNCFRIGYGKGFYDKTLSKKEASSLITIGLAYEFQMFPKLPQDPTDVQLHAVLSEKNLYLR